MSKKSEYDDIPMPSGSKLLQETRDSALGSPHLTGFKKGLFMMASALTAVFGVSTAMAAPDTPDVSHLPDNAAQPLDLTGIIVLAERLGAAHEADPKNGISVEIERITAESGRAPFADLFRILGDKPLMLQMPDHVLEKATLADLTTPLDPGNKFSTPLDKILSYPYASGETNLVYNIPKETLSQVPFSFWEQGERLRQLPDSAEATPLQAIIQQTTAKPPRPA